MNSDFSELVDADEIRAFLDNYQDEPLPLEHILSANELATLKAADSVIYFARLSEGDPNPGHGLRTDPRPYYSGD